VFDEDIEEGASGAQKKHRTSGRASIPMSILLAPLLMIFARSAQMQNATATKSILPLFTKAP
jgi:hypothetical protein